MTATRPHGPSNHPGRRRLDDPGTRRGTTSLLQSFNYATEGIVWTLKSQRNMRIHFGVAIVVLVLAFVYDVSRLELIALLLSITFVLVAEMVNTAIEAATDVATSSFHPLAKIAKDISAGAVLIATINAVGVGYLVLANRLGDDVDGVLVDLRDAPLSLTIAALGVVLLVTITIKAMVGRGTPLRGGFPSGHAALAFAAWMSLTFVTAGYEHRVLVSTIMLLLAVLVAQSRVEAAIHSVVEVVAGAALGSVLTLVLFQAFG